MQLLLSAALLSAASLGSAAPAAPAAPPGDTTPQAEQDEVTALPGWEDDGGKPLQLPSRHFSGYLPVGPVDAGRALHYYFMEAEESPATAPLVLWLNGGPGSSSLFGMFTEVGQLVFSRDSLATNKTEAPRLFRNPEAWTTVANMLFLESPVGVGWSYCAASLNEGKPCVCNDTSTANENHDALLQFTKRFPSLKDRPFFISGESYAGIYIPTLAEVIMNKGGMNLQGMAVGNGCWGSGENLYCGFGKEQKRLEAEFLFGHGFYSKMMKAQLDTACHWTPGQVSPTSAGCAQVLDEVGARSPHRQGNGPKSVGTSEYIYDQCGYNPQSLMGASDQARRLRESAYDGARAAVAYLLAPAPRRRFRV